MNGFLGATTAILGSETVHQALFGWRHRRRKLRFEQQTEENAKDCLEAAEEKRKMRAAKRSKHSSCKSEGPSDASVS